jgi:hypothetical protein
MWVTVAIPVVYYAVIHRIPLSEVENEYLMRFSTDELVLASWLALGAVVVVAAGIRAGLAEIRPISWERLRDEIRSLSIERLFWAHVGMYAFDFAFRRGGDLLALGGLAQATIALTLVRWGFFFLLTFAVLVHRKKYRYLTLAIAIEIGLGLLGFFGSFREFFFIFVVAYAVSRPRMRMRESTTVATILGVLIFVGVFWQHVKPTYRAFLSKNPQVTVAEEANRMWQLVEGTSGQDLANTVEPTVRRIGTKTLFFGEVIEYIPERRPYDGGAGWRRGIEHILKPRLFFPDKPPLNASRITNRYIARTVSGPSQGASFAIGYFGESYADFGPIWMFVPIFLVGLMLGLMYRFFILESKTAIMGFAFAAALLTARIGGLHDIPKMLGSTITQFMVMSVLMYYFAPLLYRWLQRT